MKIFWRTPQVLQLEAENSADLNMVRDLLQAGVLPGARRLSWPLDQVPFPCEEGAGMVTLIGQSMMVGGLAWDVQANQGHQQQLQAAYSALQGVQQFLRLCPIQGQAHLPLPTAGVAPI